MLDSDDPKKMAEYIAAADRYFRELADSHLLFAKPYVPLQHAGYNVARLGYLLHHLDPQAFHTVLDFGAGACWLTVVLLRTGCRVTALDVSQAALELGAEAIRAANVPAASARVRLLTYDGFRIPLADACIDRVACYDALHHVPNKRTVLAELYRVLRNGGRACFVEPGPGHAASAEAIREARVWGVLEDEVDAPQVCAIAADVGFTSSYVVPLPRPADNSLSPDEFKRLRDDACRHVEWTGNDSLIVLTKLVGGRPDSRSPGTLLADVTIRTCPDDVARGERFKVEIDVSNLGDTVWLALPSEAAGEPPFDYASAFLSLPSSRTSANTSSSVSLYRRYIQDRQSEGAVTIGAKLWRVGEDEPIDIDYGRGFLARDIHPGESAAVTIHLRAPADAGMYRLTFEPVAELLCWFSDRGSPVAHRYLSVDGGSDVPDSRAPGRLAAGIGVVEGDTPDVLLVTLQNDGDTTWLAHPLLGGGWVQLGLQALSNGRRELDRDWRRVALPRDVRPGETVTLAVDLRDVPASVEAIRLDLVCELRMWFADHGSQVLEHPLGRKR
jgi:SAM-dependent methyltransferase